MRKVKEIREDVLSHPGRYRKVRTEGRLSKDPAPLKVKEVALRGKRCIITITNFSAQQLALKYKELWQVEQVFRDVKSVLEGRPVYHQKDENIRGHVLCSFLALVLRKELDRRLQEARQSFEWADIKQDLKALQEVEIQDTGRPLALRTECVGAWGKVFKAVGVAIPPAIREL